MTDKFTVEPARSDDKCFIGECLCFSERAHTGVGIWDLICEPDTAEAMGNASLQDSAHFTIQNFVLARDISTGKPVAGACGFVYPEFSVEKSKASIIGAMKTLRDWSEEEGDAAWRKISFLEEALPDYDAWEGSWLVEAVYCAPEYRGHGLGSRVVNEVLARGAARGCHQALLTCAVGNEGALRMYKHLGFSILGTGFSSRCKDALGSEGFHLLQKSL
jgi:RimJ/RimL family protein N-acetyltransferase